MNFEVASNITKLSLETSKDIIDNVERIKILTNHTLADIRKNLDVISSALDGVTGKKMETEFSGKHIKKERGITIINKLLIHNKHITYSSLVNKSVLIFFCQPLESLLQ